MIYLALCNSRVGMYRDYATGWMTEEPRFYFRETQETFCVLHRIQTEFGSYQPHIQSVRDTAAGA
jgi:hypothetical protein